jgi:hypothetical protein
MEVLVTLVLMVVAAAATAMGFIYFKLQAAISKSQTDLALAMDNLVSAVALLQDKDLLLNELISKTNALSYSQNIRNPLL